MPTTKKRLNITLNDDTYEVLEKLASKRDQSMSALGRKLIEHALELQEDLYFSKIADERLERGEERLAHEKAWE